MAKGIGEGREISLGDDFGDVVVKAGNMRVAIHADGRILAYTNGVGVTIRANRDVQVLTPGKIKATRYNMA